MNKIETTAGPISHYPSIRPVDEFNLAIMLAPGNSYIKKHAEKSQRPKAQRPLRETKKRHITEFMELV